ncbi:DsbA family protein [Pararhodobacter zhoushanensis]|uniref:DsbA family protein n=1 Tax=Pararhodobacter zhoushanensis TaxID=2479545 RepID=UPI001FEC2DF9|nr:DsbA family protein [Pararhodobacter zhoushanensis]
MVRQPLIAATLAALTFASPVLAQSTAMQMSDSERSAFRAEVRAYLMENPEVIFEAVSEFERRNQAQQGEMDLALVEINAEAIFDDGHSWATGNLDGDITLVEFMDYRCGFCRRAQPEVLSMLEADGNIRLIIKELPILGPDSEIMSRFAVAVQQLAGDEAYGAVHDALMAWEGSVTPDDLRSIAADIGFDAEPALAAMNSPEVNQVLNENRALAQRLQISGTPTFVMGDGTGGELLRGYMPAAEMSNVVTRLRG